MAAQSVDFFDDRDDADLLVDARNGDAHSADVLWVRVRPSVLAVARGIADNQHDAEDLASEAMSKVFAAIAGGHGPTESILPYLYATMRNLHISTLRREARVGTPLELTEQRVLNLVKPEPDAIESELVTRAFKNLPARWRYVLWAYLVEGRPGQEIADELGIKPAAVHALKARALEGLRQQYLGEHAKLSEEQECASVHRVLASIARGRARRTTDLNQVWRHLRSCEHCAEGYREITEINNRIGALLGPAAATLVAFVPHGSGTAGSGFLHLPFEAGKFVAAAGVAGAIAVAGTTFTVAHHQTPAAASSTPSAGAAAPATTTPASSARPSATTPKRARSVANARADAKPCAPLADGAGELTEPLALDPILPGTSLDGVVPDTCSTPPSVHTVTQRVDPAATLAGLNPAETVTEAVPVDGRLRVPAPETAIPDLSVPETGLLQR